MIKKFVIRIYEIIKNVLNGNQLISSKNNKTLFCISFVYTLIWIIFVYNPYELYTMLKPPISTFSLKEAIIASSIYIILVYLPEIIIFLLDFLIKKFNIQNQIFIKFLIILINILSYIYLILLGLYICFIAIFTLGW